MLSFARYRILHFSPPACAAAAASRQPLAFSLFTPPLSPPLSRYNTIAIEIIDEYFTAFQLLIIALIAAITFDDVTPTSLFLPFVFFISRAGIASISAGRMSRLRRH